jgi:hypothetical protein
MTFRHCNNNTDNCQNDIHPNDIKNTFVRITFVTLPLGRMRMTLILTFYRKALDIMALVLLPFG